MSIGERISELRKERNLSQAQLAKMLDVSRQAVSKWENDLTAPDTIKLIQLSDVLDTDVEYLATGRHSAPQTEPSVVKIADKADNAVKIIEKPVVRIIERPIVEFVEKPVIKKVTRTRYLRNPVEYAAVGVAGLLIGIVIGVLI